MGAVVGATINPLFTSYYQQMGHVQFRLRKLEKSHDPAEVNACFSRIMAAQRKKAKPSGRALSPTATPS